MAEYRKITRITKAENVSDGAGVAIQRLIGFYEKNEFDPFLLLDYFGSDKESQYISGFPWHPHRGIETVTFMIKGSVEHGDSMGNKGLLKSGDVQWMTAGSGIIHQEMPQYSPEGNFGFQLWVNLPKSHKMMPPRYQDVPAETIPEIMTSDGTKVRVIAGGFQGTTGPVRDIICDPLYLYVEVPANSEFEMDLKIGHTFFIAVSDGTGFFDTDDGVKSVKALSLVLFGDGDKVKVTTKDEKLSFIAISGKPLKEPVAWRGPIVMNTEEELMTAFREYRDGTFIK